jgi:flagellar L-ring protein precursor FlgH
VNFARSTLVAAAFTMLVAGSAQAQAGADSTPQPQPQQQRRPGLASWTTDRRDFRVGDVVTIVVDERTIASADKSNLDESGRSTNAGLNAATGSGKSTDVSFRARLDNESAVRGQARRRDVLTTELSARIVAVEEGGVLKLEGSRVSRIDKAEQRVTIVGFARAQDISASNVIESWRLANAELLYESKGDLGKPKQGIISKILGILWP